MDAAGTMIQTALLGEAIDAGPALVFVADEQMKYVAVNQRACSALGYSREELLTLSVSEVARSDDAPSMYEEMLAQGFLNGTTALTCKDGTTVDFAYRACTTRVAGLEFFVAVGFVRD